MKLDTKMGNVTLEQGLLVFALVLIAAAGLYKAFTYGGEEKAVIPRSAAIPPFKDPKGYSDVAAGLSEIPVLKPREHNLFIPRLIVFNSNDGSIKVLNWDDPMSDGITPRWKQEYGFDIADPGVAMADPDSDGYNNKEEFDSKTDPNDKTSSPPVIKKLFVKSYNPVQLQIIFKGYNETEPGSGIYEYQINTPTLAKRSWRLKEGEVIKVDDFNKYVIGKFRPKIVKQINPRTGIEEDVDISELDVRDPRLDENITLKFNTKQTSDQSTVGFELHVPGESPDPAEVTIGKKFKIRSTEYQLRTADENSATILDLKTNQELVILKAGAAPAPTPAPAPDGAPAPGGAPAGSPAPATP